MVGAEQQPDGLLAGCSLCALSAALAALHTLLTLLDSASCLLALQWLARCRQASGHWLLARRIARCCWLRLHARARCPQRSRLCACEWRLCCAWAGEQRASLMGVPLKGAMRNCGRGCTPCPNAAALFLPCVVCRHAEAVAEACNMSLGGDAQAPEVLALRSQALYLCGAPALLGV